MSLQSFLMKFYLLLKSRMYTESWVDQYSLWENEIQSGCIMHSDIKA